MLLFIYLAALGLRRGIFNCGMQILSYGMWENPDSQHWELELISWPDAIFLVIQISRRVWLAHLGLRSCLPYHPWLTVPPRLCISCKRKSGGETVHLQVINE